MPLYMDLHRVTQGETAEELADAHDKDLAIQQKYKVNYLTYWWNEASGHVFCLVDAPSVNAAIAVHRESSGLVADEIIEVEEAGVHTLLGDGSRLPSIPQPIEQPDSERDRALRTILFTDMEGSTALTQRLGDAGAMGCCARTTPSFATP